MAGWIKGGKLLQSPAIWIGGGCHVGNLGPVANAQGNIDIPIRDFDQTVIGNPVHGLIRLGLLLTTAVPDSVLSGVVTAQMMEQLVAGYESCFDEKTDEEKEFLDAATVKVAMKEAAGRSWEDLAWERMEDMPGVNGERVIEGARHLSPYLGDRMIAAQVFDHSVFVGELLPQDMKA